MKADRVKINERFDFCNTEKHELNLVYKKNLTHYTFHSPEGAVQEVGNWLNSEPLQCQVLYVFGTGLGYSFLKLKTLLQQNPQMHLVFIEPLLGVLMFLFQTDFGKMMIEHPRVHFVHFSNKSQFYQMLNQLSCDFSLLKGQVICSPIYQKRFPKICKILKRSLPEVQQSLSSLITESGHARTNFFRNFCQLAHNLNGRYNGMQLGDQFKGVPCIIVGAGPSLQKNIHLLKGLEQKALILAGSSAISGLTQQGLHPHLGNYFDPYLRLYSRFQSSIDFELPTFHCARTFSEVSRWIHGPPIYLKGSMSTPVVNWLENNLGFLGIQNPESISVTASNVFMAQLMGCNPIILVGVDLAFTDQKLYMEGVEKESSKEAIEEDPQSAEFQFNEEITALDIHGKSVKTRYGWLLESEVISEMAFSTPNIQFYNCTEGGLGFKGVSNLPLQQVADWFLKKELPIQEMLHAALQEARVNYPHNPKQIQQDLKSLEQSLRRCKQYYKKTLRQLKELNKLNKLKRLKEMNTEFLNEVIERLSHEIGYQYLLKRYHQVIDIPLLKHKFLKKQLSVTSPIELSHNIILKDMISRFSQYLQVCDEFLINLKSSTQSMREDPW